MKKLLLFTLACAYGMSISAMDKPKDQELTQTTEMQIQPDSQLPYWYQTFLKFLPKKDREQLEQEPVPQNLPKQESSEEPDVAPEIDWKKLGEQAEQTIFQNCKNAIENRDNNAANLLSSIPSIIARTQLIALAKVQVTIDKFRVKQSIKKNGTSMVGSFQLLPDPSIKDDYEKSVMVLAGLKQGKLS